MRLSLSALLLALSPVVATAQNHSPLLYVDGRTTFIALKRPLLLNRPTVLVLVSLPHDPLTRDDLTRAQAFADSVTAALQPIAAAFGYVVEARSTDFLGILDTKAGASYEPSPERGPGIHLLRPSYRPSILYPMLTPAELAEAVRDYGQTFRPIVPL